MPHTPAVTIKVVFRHCQMFSGGQNSPHWRTTELVPLMILTVISLFICLLVHLRPFNSAAVEKPYTNHWVFGVYIREVHNPVKVSKGAESWNACVEPGAEVWRSSAVHQAEDTRCVTRGNQRAMGTWRKESLIWGGKWGVDMHRTSQGCLSHV